MGNPQGASRVEESPVNNMANARSRRAQQEAKRDLLAAYNSKLADKPVRAQE